VFARHSPGESGFNQVGCLDDSPQAPMARGLRDVLIVDPDPQALFAAQVAVKSVANVEACSDFRVARARLASRPPDFLVTNLRLERFNGLHLVHAAAGTATRCIVYATQHDEMLAREVVAAGAFYERADRLPRVLASYLRGTLPGRDRRSLLTLDRRSLPRGGRRCSDT
jgi:DNA-binding NarL/FixJ family response regulator